MRRKRKQEPAVAPAEQPTPYPTDIPGRPWQGLYVGNGSPDRSTISMAYAGPESSVLVVGPPRSGKTSGLVIPNVLECSGRRGLDLDQARRVRGHQVSALGAGQRVRLRPDRDHRDPRRHLPAALVARGRLRHLRCRGGHGPRPGLGGASGLGASPNRPTGSSGPRASLAPLLFAANQRGADMAAVCRWVLGRDLREPQAALEDSGHEMAQSVLAGIVATDERERSGIFSTASGLLAAYRSEAALATTRNVNFDPARFVRSTDALYICAPAHAQEQLAPLVVALLEQIRSAVYARPKNAAPVVFVLDEVASIAPLPSLPALAAEGGGQGLVTMACLQDLSQARARWGEVAEGFFSIFNTKVIFPGIGDHRTLQLISALAGDEQVPIQTISRWAGEWGRIRHSVSVAPQFRPRLPIDQVARGVPGYTLNLSAAGMHWAAHIPWFEHKWWRALVEYGNPLFGERTRPGVPKWHPDSD